MKHCSWIRLCSLLTICFMLGCDASPGGKTEKVLNQFQKFNDGVQASVFDSTKLVAPIADKDLTPESKFRTNSYRTDTPTSDTSGGWRLEVQGLVKYPGLYTLDMIKSLGTTVQNTKHVCVEGWSQNVKWGGTRLRDFLDWIGTNSDAKYVYVECSDKYYTSYDMASARHPQTLLCYEAYNKPLTLKHGAPCRIVMPTKLGYKSAKWVTKILVTNTKPGGYWEDKGYDWNAGL